MKEFEVRRLKNSEDKVIELQFIKLIKHKTNYMMHSDQHVHVLFKA